MGAKPAYCALAKPSTAATTHCRCHLQQTSRGAVNVMRAHAAAALQCVDANRSVHEQVIIGCHVTATVAAIAWR